MSTRSLALLPIVLVAVLFSLHAGFTSEPQYRLGFDVICIVAKIAGATGAVLAARSFDRGDYMRYAFTFEAGMFVCFVIRDGFALTPPLHAALEAVGVYTIVWRALFVLANALGLTGAFMMARAAMTSGFDADQPLLRRLSWLIVASIMGLAITGPSLVLSFDGMFAGQLRSLVMFIGSTADLGSFVLTVPIVRLAYAMRGGLLHIPWTFVATARILWMAYDLATSAPDWLHRHYGYMVLEEATRSAACFYSFAAGLAFYKVFRGSQEQ